MFDQYKKALQNFYKAQKDSKNLPSDLEYPNRTKLKQAFLRLYKIKNEKSDTEIIRRFFDPDNKYENQIDSIEKIDIDKLRPLVTFLTTESKLQADPAVHALAWLLGFPPYNEWRTLPEDNNSSGPTVPKTVKVLGDKGNDTTTSEKSSKIYILFGIAIITSISLAMSWQYITTTKIYNPTANQKCMYWDGNQYVTTVCDQYSNDETLIPLNMRALKNLKKVKWPDLLTKNDIGKVYYSRKNGQHEFFTDSGSYPLDPQRRLKPMSTYIWSHHVNFYRFILQSLFWFAILILIIVILFVSISRVVRKYKFRLSSSTITPNREQLNPGGSY